MHTVEVEETPASPMIMGVGEIAVVVQAGSPEFSKYIGHIVVRAFSGLLSLTNPKSTWGEPSAEWPNFKVRILPAGTKITITVGE